MNLNSLKQASKYITTLAIISLFAIPTFANDHKRLTAKDCYAPDKDPMWQIMCGQGEVPKDQSKSIQNLEFIEKKEEVISNQKELNRLLVDLEEVVSLKANQCIKAIGNAKLCKCISEKIPLDIDFIGYVNLITRKEDEVRKLFDYASLSNAEKQYVDSIIKIARNAREECVSSMVNIDSTHNKN